MNDSKQNLLITNAAIYTADQQNPQAEAVAVQGNRIVYVGSNEGAKAYQTPQTRVIDGGGRTLLPGLIDSHFHLYMGSMALDTIPLDRVRGLEELGQILRQLASDHPEQEWIRGNRLAYDVVAGDRPLTRQHLDEILPDRPMLLYSSDLHTAWVNTIALEQAGILQGHDLPQGEVVMGADGLASGQLNESPAMSLVKRLIPKPTDAERLELLRRGLQRVASYGITSIHNMFGDAKQFRFYHTLEKADELTCRVYVPFLIEPDMSLDVIVNEAMPLRHQYQSERLRGGSVKLFMDGVIESYTALMLDPYANRPDTAGNGLFTAEQFNEFAIEADKHGFQIKVHAIGDGAVRRTLDGFEAAQQANGKRDSRHRIEHIECLHADDLSRFAELGAVASMQPLHASRPDIDYYVNWMHCIGPERYARAFLWRDLYECDVPLCFGSDWNVVTMNPFMGMEAAVNQQAWGPTLKNQALPLDVALDCYTRQGAYAEFMEGQKGQIKVGMLADLALLSDNIFEMPTTAIKDLAADLTICDGEIVYER